MVDTKAQPCPVLPVCTAPVRETMSLSAPTLDMWQSVGSLLWVSGAASYSLFDNV